MPAEGVAGLIFEELPWQARTRVVIQSCDIA